MNFAVMNIFSVGLRYTVLQILVFAVFLLILGWAEVPDVWALLFAALFSMVTSLSFCGLSGSPSYRPRRCDNRVGYCA